MTQRAADTGDEWAATAYPVEAPVAGHPRHRVPVRATISSFGHPAVEGVGAAPDQESRWV